MLWILSFKLGEKGGFTFFPKTGWLVYRGQEVAMPFMHENEPCVILGHMSTLKHANGRLVDCGYRENSGSHSGPVTMQENQYIEFSVGGGKIVRITIRCKEETLKRDIIVPMSKPKKSAA